MSKALKALAVGTVFAAVFAGTAFAGTWKTGAARPDDWWYDNGDGTWAVGWTVIDGDNDGMGEWYYFDQDGWLLTADTTPDGYEVDENGAWVYENEIVKQPVTKAGPGETSTVITQETAADASGAQAADAGAQAAQASEAQAQENVAGTIAEMPEGTYRLSYYTYNKGQYTGFPVNGDIDIKVVGQSAGSIQIEFTRTYVDGRGYSYYRSFDKQASGQFTCTDESVTDPDIITWNAPDRVIMIGNSDMTRFYDLIEYQR